MVNEEQGIIIDRSIQYCNQLVQQERYTDAMEILRQVLRVDPTNQQAVQRLKYLQSYSNNDEEVIAFYHDVLKLEPNCHITLNNLALRLSQIGRNEEALEYANKAIALKPSDANYLNNLGLIYKKMNHTEEAMKYFAKSLEIDKDPYVMINLGSALADQLKLEEAAQKFQEALAIRSGISGAHINLAYCYHLLGDHKQGWENYEHRLRHYSQLIAYMSLFGEERKWGGQSSLEGKRLAVFCEQGLGDAIMMSRYFKYLKEKGCYLIVQCNEALVSLFKGAMPHIDKVESKTDVVEGRGSEFDYHVPTMSLPLVLNKPDPSYGHRYIRFPKSNKPKDEDLRVGIVWQGSKLHPNDQYRSCGFSYFEPLLGMPSIKWFNLQLEPSDHPKIINTEFKDLADTAELISTLDLVISIDTSVLHLAGAMGVPTWALLTYRPDFRWGLGETTPWYESMKLIRQKNNGDWQSVFDQVKKGLDERTRMA